MPVNRFSLYVEKVIKNELLERQAEDELRSYLIDASLDYSGSPLKALLDKKQSKLGVEFMDYMKLNGFIGAERLNLYLKRNFAKHSDNHSLIFSTKQSFKFRLKTKLRYKVLWSGKGYPIGVLADKSSVFIKVYTSVPVYLCTDLKLRCPRIKPLFSKTIGHGFGSLPLKRLSLYELHFGKFVESNVEGMQTEFKESDLESRLQDFVKALL